MVRAMEKSSSIKSRIAKGSAAAAAAAFLCIFWVVVCGRSSYHQQAAFASKLIQSAHRQLIKYSERSVIPEDPDSLPTPDDLKEEYATKYGRWHFWDGEEGERAEDKDLCAKYPPHCDIDGDDFEDTAWQADAVFTNHILNDADGLLSRAMEAIFEEYGHPKPKTAEGMAERMKMFHWEKIDLATADGPPEAFQKRGSRGNGGWTTKRSFEGLVRRLLHAIMTNGTFTVALAGHSAAAGHGNHFRQSYIMTMHKIMAPIFARLGVQLITHNFSQGGLGTIQNAMGAGDLYGQEIDLLLWDSGMTEPGARDKDFFFRQGLLGGKRVPVVWAAGGCFDILKLLHEKADIDVGEFGSGMDGIEATVSDKQAKELPWAVRYLKCEHDAQDICKQNDDYCAKCWIDRDDGVKPEATQLENPKGQVRWHPGWRQHQLQGRVIAFALMEAMQAAVTEFSDGTMGGPPLAEDFWHVGDYYKNQREKLLALKEGECLNLKDVIPERMCWTPMHGRSQFTPRKNFDQSSIVSIVKPATDGYVPRNEKKMLYEGRDAHNECYDIPSGQVDVLAVVSGRRRRLGQTSFDSSTVPALQLAAETTLVEHKQVKNERTTPEKNQQQRQLGEITPGRGWEVSGEPDGYCDGSYYAACNRWTNNPCILAGHHDARGALVGNGYSGWLVMTLKDLKEGLIVIKVHSWQDNEDNTITKDWNSENKERMLGKGDPADTLPDSFKFEYAINGKVTTMNKKEYVEKRQIVQRVVETLTLLDDPTFVAEGDVELAIRVTGGCGRECTIGLSHVYWA